MQIDLGEASDRLGELVQRVLAGEGDVVITRDGRPLARIVAIVEEPPLLGERVPGSAKGLFVVPDDFDEPLDDA